MSDARVDAGRQGFIWKFRLLSRLLYYATPGKELGHPAPVLLSGVAGLIARQVFRFPRRKRRANLVPVFDGGVKTSQHPRLEAADLADFERKRFQRLSNTQTHASKLTASIPSGKRSECPRATSCLFRYRAVEPPCLAGVRRVNVIVRTGLQ